MWSTMTQRSSSLACYRRTLGQLYWLRADRTTIDPHLCDLFSGKWDHHVGYELGEWPLGRSQKLYNEEAPRQDILVVCSSKVGSICLLGKAVWTTSRGPSHEAHTCLRGSAIPGHPCTNTVMSQKSRVVHVLLSCSMLCNHQRPNTKTDTLFM